MHNAGIRTGIFKRAELQDKICKFNRVQELRKLQGVPRNMNGFE